MTHTDPIRDHSRGGATHLTLPIAMQWVPSLSPHSGRRGTPLTLSAHYGGRGRGPRSGRVRWEAAGPSTHRLARPSA